LVQGDTCYVVGGADTQVVLAGVMELITAPLANVTL
jgi:hypothetical protein